MAASSFIFELNPFPRPPPSSTPYSKERLLYGPSLRKGRRTATTPTQRPTVSADDQPLIDRDALRVPTGRCSALEARLRGHLLNWPRVPGDDVDPPAFNLLLPLAGDCEGEGGVSMSVGRRLYGDGQRLNAVLYLDELAKTFDCRGYLKFRNLARISRPARKVKEKKKEEEGVVAVVESGVAPRAAHRNYFAVVGVVDDVGDGGIRIWLACWAWGLEEMGGGDRRGFSFWMSGMPIKMLKTCRNR